MTAPQNSDIIALFRPRAGLPGATFLEFGEALPQSSTPVEDEGTQVVASPTALNFIGAGVTAANNAGVADITIPGAAAIGLDGLTDVTLTAEATGEILFKSAGDWLNTNALTVTPTGSIVLKFNGGIRLTTVNPGVLVNRGANDDVHIEILSESNADAVLLLTNNLVGGVRLFLNPTGGVASIQQTDAAGNPQDFWLRFTRDGAVEGFHNNVAMFRSALAASGGMEVNNTVTGAGFERVLTTGDISAATVETLSWKSSVRVATTVDGTLATAYENGDTIDGIVLATGDRILLKDQTAGAENGIYTVEASGAPTRATDFDADAEVNGGAAIVVSEGTANADLLFLLTTNDPITVGTTALVFTEFTGGGAGATFITAFKAAQTNRISTTTLADDPDLRLTLPVGRWIVEGYLHVSSASSTPNFKFRWNKQSGLTTLLDYFSILSINELKTVIGEGHNGIANQIIVDVVANENSFIRTWASMQVSVTGDLVFQWAQDVSTATNTILNGMSYISAFKLD